jgi:cobalt-zinc-cadmium efflux system membrane fusion protein
MRWSQTLLITLAASLAACSGGAPAANAEKKEAPASIANPTSEAALTTVTLSREAVQRLGIETTAAKVEQLSGTRTLGGEVVVPEGRSVTVSAPVAGTLIAAGPVRPGSSVARGDTLFRLVPLVPTERDQRIEAERAVSAAEAEEQVARQRVQRLEQLLKDGAASVRAVEEARAQQGVVVAALAAARDRLNVVTRNPIGPQGEIAISSPLAGILQSVSAAPGQAVSASTPLFQVAQVDPLWIRVPVYAGDAAGIDAAKPAAVSVLGSAGPLRSARRVSAPPRADPTAASIDLFYELSSERTPLQPGERVTVQVPLLASERGLVLPESAVVFDVHGATWVYEDLGGGRFARRRVEIARYVADRALISRGVAPGTNVVTVGVAELFGTEFGAGK